MIHKCIDTRLNVQPVSFGLIHRYTYEGPCRFAAGEALTGEYDEVAAAQAYEEFKQAMKDNLPDFVNVLEPLYFDCYDDWVLPQDMFDKMMENGSADVYLINSGIARERQIIELGERSGKPIILDPTLGCMVPAISASLYARGIETFTEVSWEGVNRALSVLRTRKAVKEANILVTARFNSNTSYACNDSFICLPHVTEKLGMHFRYMNMHELMDYLLPLGRDRGNPTTPLRFDTPNLTDEDIKEAEKLAHELQDNADPENKNVPFEYLLNSCKSYILVKKLLNIYDCCGFTMPCPDCCSTTRLNDQKVTFCLNHSLLMEQGIPSTCDSDVNSLTAILMLTTLSMRSPYLGNTWRLLQDKDGKILPQWHFEPEKDLEPGVDRSNLYLIDHSTMVRNLHGINEDHAKYGLRHFAFDQQFGAVLRYDYKQDIGQDITLCRFSPDCSKMLIGRGTIVSGGGYESDNCNGYVIFRVSDGEKFFNAQKYTGNHMALVYGDYTKELKMLAELFALEPMCV